MKKEKIQIEIDVPSKSFNVRNATCPNGHSLADESVTIHGHPSLKVKATSNGKSGFLYLDPIYGSYDNIEKGFSMREGDLAEFFCPECGVSLIDPDDTCQLCSAPLFIFHLPRGSFVEGCTRKGCMFHKLKIVTGEQQMGRLFGNSILERLM